jgi:hypothetical protein
METLPHNRDITLKIYLKNEKIKTYLCKRSELSQMKLDKLRQKLKFPPSINSEFYFNIGNTN